MILASQLKERITLQQPVRTSDTYGGATVSWEDVAELYADVQPLISTARKGILGDEVTGSAGYRVSIRTRDDVHAQMRILWKTRTLTIHSLHETAATIEILAYEEGV